jgi:hypothetical protein
MLFSKMNPKCDLTPIGDFMATIALLTEVYRDHRKLLDAILYFALIGVSITNLSLVWILLRWEHTDLILKAIATLTPTLFNGTMVFLYRTESRAIKPIEKEIMALSHMRNKSK